MKNEKSLFGLTEFWLSILVPLFASVIVGAIILSNSDLRLDLSYQGFNKFIEIFTVPLGILALVFPMVALVASNHRSRQSAAQIELGKSQNNFSNFYKHKESFHEMIERLEKKYDVTFFDPDSLYTIIFPNNSPVSITYSLQGRDDGYVVKSRDSLFSLLQESSEIGLSENDGLENSDLIKKFYEDLHDISEGLKFRVNSGLYISWSRKYKTPQGDIKEESIDLKQKMGLYTDEYYVFGHVIMCDEMMRSLSGFCQTDNYESAYTGTPLWVWSKDAKEAFNSCVKFGNSEMNIIENSETTSPVRSRASALLESFK